MSLVEESNDNPTDIISFKSNNSIFIWLDILGFAEAVNEDKQYKILSDLLNKFQNLFFGSNFYKPTIISDGMVLYIEEPQKVKLKTVLKEIAEKQFNFILENKFFIRGGIGVGTKYSEDDKQDKDVRNSMFISNGLARSVKLESSFINWPVIGIDEANLSLIREIYGINKEDEFFGLSRGYNQNGQSMFFIDFIEEKQEYFTLLQNKIHEFEKKENQHIRNKYIWLLRYYLHKYKDQVVNKSLEGIVL
ncbi:hypothetical protein [Aliarcobacter butzleri]|uniref:hypothetical protein n=1 Tax=Aliarcobacter butzleri TaxID=28197 RepID=UPI00022959E3|nr:hypothetical protein [Aliarcobacter butzleri]MCT7611411.1 hypothetical protein [Aliarcobacter butzleri]MDN5094305.1 hypothetical protein [Aliarcobacter butzleri]BAK71807.1 hypothetical protein ABED_2090 [Aliarcobacter butzleri ED-1]